MACHILAQNAKYSKVEAGDKPLAVASCYLGRYDTAIDSWKHPTLRKNKQQSCAANNHAERRKRLFVRGCLQLPDLHFDIVHRARVEKKTIEDISLLTTGASERIPFSDGQTAISVERI